MTRPAAGSSLVDAVAASARRLDGTPADHDALLEAIGDAHFVLLGEATHGTHEFYRVRAEITKRLIRERGFNAVAVEADWPDAYRVNQYVRGRPGDHDATEALGGFRRFPQWMWRNADTLDFVGWLREWNDAHPSGHPRVGFYGLDLYSLHASMDAVLDYLRRVDPEAAQRARARYACFDHAGGDPQRYGYAAGTGAAESCEEAVVHQLTEMLAAAGDHAAQDRHHGLDAQFAAEQNARVVMNAEAYYRAMFRGRSESWNLRDTHMEETLYVLAEHLEARQGEAKVVVWAHNSHLGDARATEMGAGGELNLGQLVRAERGRDARLVGFSTYTGSVTAADDWDEPARRMRVRPALEGSYEALFHEVGMARGHRDFLLDLTVDSEAREALDDPRLQRAIGVIYRPRTERQSHYFKARLPRQFDCLLHYDTTRAVEPLERTAKGTWVPGEAEPPETWPSAL
jgi:erythromycin esterase-like protein